MIAVRTLLSVALLVSACSEPSSRDAAPLVAGTFRLAAAADDARLTLEPSGTFRWTIDGGDYSGGDTGVWRSEKGAVVLAPANGRSSFEWTVGGSFRSPVSRVTLAKIEGDALVARGVVTRTGRAFEQTWKR